MLIYTEQGRQDVLDALNHAKGYGDLTDNFTTKLHTALSNIHLQPNTIKLVCGNCVVRQLASESGQRPELTIECEFAMTWIKENGQPYMHGGLVYNNWNKSFGLHT
jgi:hypothetical protein